MSTGSHSTGPQATLHDSDDTESGASGGQGPAMRLLVFSGEIYVTAALIGALSSYAVRLGGAGEAWALAAALLFTFLLRAAGIVFKIRLLPGGIAPPKD